MNVILLSARTGWHTDELCRALAARGHVGLVQSYEALISTFGSRPATLASPDTPILEADAVLARIVPNGSLEQVIHRLDTLHWIESRGLPVINSPRTIERCVNKARTTALLQEAGLPVPETVVCERAADAVAAVRAMGDVVLKPIFGSMGHGLTRLTDPEIAFRVARALEQVGAVFYVQRTIDHGGSDVRAFVVGTRVVAAIERHAPPGDWRTNVALGGTATPFDLPAEWEAMAVAAAAAVGADYAGVDLVRSSDGALYVLEVNGIPGWEGVQRTTSVDVAGAIVERLIDRRRGASAPLAADSAAELRA